MAIYLDHAATTAMSAKAVAVYSQHAGVYGNPASLHGFGRQARAVLDESRESLAADLGAHPSEVVFTSGGTLSNNLAIKGSFWAQRDHERSIVLTSAIEHHAVLEPAQWLAKDQGAEHVVIPVDESGFVSLEFVRSFLAEHHERVALVSVMWANNEVGTIQPIAELAALTKEFGVFFHVDAVQAVGQLPVRFADSGIDALSVSAHKVGGPVGVGALLLSRSASLTPVIHGGNQERLVHSGTVQVAGAAAFATALTEVTSVLPARIENLQSLRNRLISGILEQVPGARLSGPNPLSESPSGGTTDLRLPNNVHFTFSGASGETLLFLLDQAGFSCSTGSACQAGVPQISHVLDAMQVPGEHIAGALRFSLGSQNTVSEIDALVSVLPQIVTSARKVFS